jgi:multiple sugar transport system ATP-binding protein
MVLVTSNNENVFKGKIVYRENLGSDIFLHVTINEGEQKIIVRSEPSMVINSAVGDQVVIGWDEQKVMVFDVDGKNVTMKNI